METSCAGVAETSGMGEGLYTEPASPRSGTFGDIGAPIEAFSQQGMLAMMDGPARPGAGQAFAFL